MGTVAKIFTVAPIGFDGNLVEVESDMTRGLPGLLIVGLGNKAIDEAKERVKSAITNSMLEYPAKRITINLAPAELPKDGTHYDLPIALALLSSSGQLRHQETTGAVFAGELALDGRLRPIKGVITVAEIAKNKGFQKIYVPKENVSQASLVSGILIIGVTSLKELFLHLKGEVLIQPGSATPSPQLLPEPSSNEDPILDDIVGQDQAKRALVIAAAGGHNIIMSGPPGAGKTVLAKTLTTLLPPLSKQELLEVTKIQNLAGITLDSTATARPFRAPHHTSSQIALIGGGAKPKPGEVSLAHRGILFLDEMPEYSRSSLEALRQPMEDGLISISRAEGKATYPASFMLVATMNPCPCGHYGDQLKECSCSLTQVTNYQRRLSGPMLDRIDMHIHVSRVGNEQLLSSNTLNNRQHLLNQKVVRNARNIQTIRYRSSIKINSNLKSKDITRYLNLSDDATSLLSKANQRLTLSPRSYFKILKVSRTIADLESSPKILPVHISEAIQYREPHTYA